MNVTKIADWEYLRERKHAVLLMWHEGDDHSKGWVKVCGT